MINTGNTCSDWIITMKLWYRQSRFPWEVCYMTQLDLFKDPEGCRT